MKLNVQQLQQIMQYLRNVAEADPNDSVSNACASLAYRLEAAGTSVFDMPMDYSRWSEVDQAAVRYAIGKRNTYRLLPGNKHAINVNSLVDND
jgi:hypothetical protein